MSNVLVGHDSEAFSEREGVGLFPMIGHVGGTKTHPLPVPGGTLQEDNVSIEMAIDPTSDEDEFVALTNSVMKEMDKKVQENGCTLVLEPTVEFTEGVLQHFAPQSMESGCDPDYNIYTKMANQYPPSDASLFRHGSGHLHVDCPLAASNPKYMSQFIMLQDIFVKAPQWLLEGNVGRNKVQGALGNYRPKAYGAEYRSSSNIILTDERILRHAFQSVQSVVTLVGRKRVAPEHIMRMRSAMESNDKDIVLFYMNHYKAKEIPI